MFSFNFINFNVYVYHKLGCPKVLRCDYGTENATIAQIQIAFRMNHDDSFAGVKSFIYGPSSANIVSCLSCFPVPT